MDKKTNDKFIKKKRKADKKILTEEEKMKKNEKDWEKVELNKDNSLRNPKFEFFYKTQLKDLITDSQSFELFIAKLKEKLPCVFRINKANHLYKEFREILLDPNLIQKLINLPKEQINLEITNRSLTNLPEWKDLVYNINIDRMELKKTQNLQNFHNFIQNSVDSGLISRQEAVSMIPPMLLKVKQGERVFDMCAAPGSKTAQFLESFYYNFDFFNKEEYLKDTGFVLANDNNQKRAYMMVHQLQRLNTAGMIVISHDAQHYPTLFEGEKNKFLFDKILTDVPCSSDAVMRKIPSKWINWSTKDSYSLHKIQLQIIKRALYLLKVGGSIIYSTCSLNPIEDEAVIAEIMRIFANDGELEIVNAQKDFIGSEIKPHCGLSNWKIFVENKRDKKQLVEIKDLEDENYEYYKQTIEPSCFPPTPEEASKFHLENCVRILPHDSDTSGFFITLIKKVKPITYHPPRNKTEIIKTVKYGDKTDSAKKPVKEEENILNLTEENNPNPITNEEIPVKEKKPKFVLLQDKCPDILKWLKDYYGLEDSFPFNQLLAQSDSDLTINFISKGVTEFLKLDIKNQLRIENAGVKLFKKDKLRKTEGNPFYYRISQDGLMYALPFMHKRIVFTTNETFKQILLKQETDLNEIKDNQFVDAIKSINAGSTVIVNVKDISKGLNKENYIDAICTYTSNQRIFLMITKEYNYIMNLRYGNII